MDCTVKNTRIEAICACVSKKSVLISDLAKELSYDENRANRLKKVNGFSSLSIIDERLSFLDMCVACVKHLCSVHNLNSSDIDAVIVNTQSHPFLIPGTSYQIQNELNLKEDVFLLDNIAGCTSFISSIIQGATLIESGMCKKVLIIVGDVTNRRNSNVAVNKDGFLESGDGCASILLTYDISAKEMNFLSKSFGNQFDVIKDEALGSMILRNPEKCLNPYFIIDGNRYNSFVLEEAAKGIEDFITKFKINKNSINRFYFQQQSRMLLQALTYQVKISENKVPFLLEQYGNLSGASIPVAIIIDNLNNKINYEQVIICGFGAGLSFNIGSVNLSDTKIYNILEI